MRRLLPLLLMLTACGGPQAFNESLAGYLGLPEAELVARFGVPLRQAELDGRRFLAYEVSRDELVPTGFGYGFRRFPIDTTTVRRLRCEVTFETTGGRVRGASSRGEGCYGALPPVTRVGPLTTP